MELGALSRWIKRASGKIPQVPAASVGLAAALYAYESNRISAFKEIEGSASYQPDVVLPVITIVIALVIALVLRRPKHRLSRSNAACAGMGAVMAVAAFLNDKSSFASLGWQASAAIYAIDICCILVLLCCWVEVLRTSGEGRALSIVAYGLIILGLCDLLTIAFKSVAALILSILAPLASLFCLRLCGADASCDTPKRADSPSGSASAAASFSLLMFLALIFFVFAHVHFEWRGLLDASGVSIVVQGFAALGILIAGASILFATRFFWGDRPDRSHEQLVFATLLFLLYFTAFAGNDSVLFNIVFLDVSEYFAMSLMLLGPYLVRDAPGPAAFLCASCIGQQVGKLMTSSVYTNPQAFNLLTAIHVAVTAAMVAALVYAICANGRGRARSGEAGCHGGSACGISGGFVPVADGVSPSDGSPVPAAVAEGQSLQAGGAGAQAGEGAEDSYGRVAASFGLTAREEEILRLLAEGKNATAIAEELCVSLPTAKSHMRNIYAKLSVHSQSELILLVRGETF